MEIYALCETGREEGFLQFLRQTKKENQWPVTAVCDQLDEKLLDAMLKEELCNRICSSKSEEKSEIRWSVYPSVSRTSLYQMSVGMDTEALPRWLKKDFEAGRHSMILTRGLDPFSGKEPKAYREKILSYIEELVKMGVLFVKESTEEEKSKFTDDKISGTEPLLEESREKRIFVPELSGKLLLVKALRRIPDGGRLELPKDTVMTPLAREYMKEHQIELG